MRKLILKTVSSIVLLSFLISSIGKANLIEPKNELKNIETFIKVWAMIKYRSPNSIVGNFDADKAFLENIKEVKQADHKKLNDILLKLINDAGLPSGKNNIVSKCKDCLTVNVNCKWINDPIYSKEVVSHLKYLSQNLNQSGNHHFINKVHFEAEIFNEPKYLDYTSFTDEAMHLLVLAKSWAAIEYLFPYKYQMDKNTKQILKEMIPVFKTINSRASYEKAILILETNINDTHAAGFLNQLKSKAEIFKITHYPPFDYRCSADGILIKSFLNDSLAQNSQLKRGDVIVEINGVKVKSWLQDRMRLLPASNMAVKYRLLDMDWRGNVFAFYHIQNQIVDVKVKRNKANLSLKLNMLNLRQNRSIELINHYIKNMVKLDEKVKPYEDLENDIALIRGGYFSNDDLPKNDLEKQEFSKNLKSKKAIIFDMRKYPNGGLFYYFIPMALGKTTFEFAKYYKANLENPGTFIRQEGDELYLSKDLKPDENSYQGKIILLTNENTQSRGEWYSMMLRQLNKNTTVIGSQTAGTDGDLKELNLPGGYKFIFTGNAVFYPDGKETQRIGIVPDINFKPAIAETLSAEDAHLQRAIKFINEGK